MMSFAVQMYKKQAILKCNGSVRKQVWSTVRYRVFYLWI